MGTPLFNVTGPPGATLSTVLCLIPGPSPANKVKGMIFQWGPPVLHSESGHPVQYVKLRRPIIHLGPEAVWKARWTRPGHPCIPANSPLWAGTLGRPRRLWTAICGKSKLAGHLQGIQVAHVARALLFVLWLCFFSRSHFSLCNTFSLLAPLEQSTLSAPCSLA